MKSERIKIEGIVQENTKKVEQFQNEVLRPILKEKHGILIQSFRLYLKQRKINFKETSESAKQRHIDSALSKDITFKNQQIGMVIGQFSEEEFETYSEHSGEYNRRILQMLKKRLKDTLT